MPHISQLGAYRLDLVKICGVTNTEDRDLVAEAGADYFGALVDVAYSPRSLTLDKARVVFDSPPIPGVVLLFNADIDRVRRVVDSLEPFAVQLLGNESPEFVARLKSEIDCQIWKTLHLPAKGYREMDLESMCLLAEDYENSGADVLTVDTVDHTAGKARLGSTGVIANWNTVRAVLNGRTVPRVVAGGINADNAVAAIQAVRPDGLDICTGVESEVGKKDPAKLARLFEVLAPYRS